MQQQWSELVKPGCRVKVKIMDKFVDAVVERTHFISKLSQRFIVSIVFCVA